MDDAKTPPPDEQGEQLEDEELEDLAGGFIAGERPTNNLDSGTHLL
jgi:hypothetical protein